MDLITDAQTEEAVMFLLLQEGEDGYIVVRESDILAALS
jgi:molybdopterin-binding protein